MKRFALLVLLLMGTVVYAQDEMPAASNAPKYPDMQYKVVKDFLQIPSDMPMAEAVGVAINSKGHIFILNRGNYPLLEFDNEGKFLSVFGGGSPIFHIPHSIRFDSEDNMWYVNSGDNLVVKFDPKRRVEQALGRREEPWVYLTHGIERALPAPSSFYQPTDTVIGPDGSTFVTDGYGNSRVAKFSKEGNLITHWGERGTGPGQFNTPHSIVIDKQQNLYVADRQNNRIQVFNTDGKFKEQWRLDGPAWSLCITPGPTQVLFVGSVGHVYKIDLTGKVLAKFGKLGRLPGYFDSIHSLTCPDEHTLYLAEEFSYRFDKITLP
jgi:DNA-binding beta-propeller fold protein YncE